MTTAIKRFFQRLNSDALAQYYQSRLEQARSTVELEAIIYTQSLISLYDWEETDSNEEQK
ncbi:hypothetical protein L3Q72_15640 [Vibrio sp. JC009]|uniref:hypothetical protein n=1 Tax=Vibrio sp. JC009 TaxID=2912314 RepID=UPI0023B1F8B7|nr:hypothetical protein [Vibrio sp. JC009]WED24311.1 hypothetical protein L3Q72_15640 [Vibrio sp. JC009]